MLEEEEKALALASAIMAGRGSAFPIETTAGADAAARAAVLIYNQVLLYVKRGVTDLD